MYSQEAEFSGTYWNAIHFYYLEIITKIFDTQWTFNENVKYNYPNGNFNIDHVDWPTPRFRNGEKETERKTTWNFAEVFFDCFFSHIRRWRGYNLSNNIIECHLKNYLLYDILWFALDFIQVSQTLFLVSNRKKSFGFSPFLFASNSTQNIDLYFYEHLRLFRIKIVVKNSIKWNG